MQTSEPHEIVDLPDNAPIVDTFAGRPVAEKAGRLYVKLTADDAEHLRRATIAERSEWLRKVLELPALRTVPADANVVEP